MVIERHSDNDGLPAEVQEMLDAEIDSATSFTEIFSDQSGYIPPHPDSDGNNLEEKD